MSLCSKMLEQYAELYSSINECGRPKTFPTPKTDMIKTDDGETELEGVLNVVEKVNDYDIEDPHQDVIKSKVQRVDPESLDFSNSKQRQE